MIDSEACQLKSLNPQRDIIRRMAHNLQLVPYLTQKTLFSMVQHVHGPFAVVPSLRSPVSYGHR
jgi:hypothetical protein